MMYMMYTYSVCRSCIYNVRAYISHTLAINVQHYMHSYIHVHEYYIFTIVHVHVHMYLHVLMRDEKEERKKQARSNKQTRQGNTAHPRQSLSLRKMSCLGWDSNP